MKVSSYWFFLNETFLSSPTIGSDDTIYTSGYVTNDGRTIVNSTVLAIQDGILKWRYFENIYKDDQNDLNNLYINSSPAIGRDGTIYIGSVYNAVYAIN